jgi:hypothetical protein
VPVIWFSHFRSLLSPTDHQKETRMTDRMVVAGIHDIAEVFRARARNITIVPPEGKEIAEFIPALVVRSTTLPELKGFDVYEVDAIIRSKASA